MDRRGIFGDRRAIERREPPSFRPARERRSGEDRRADERRAEIGDRRQRETERHQRPPHQSATVAPPRADWTAGLPPVSRLIPAAVVLIVSLLDLFVAQATDKSAWGLFVVAAGIPIAAFALTAPRRWHLAAVWFAVGAYAVGAAVHIVYLLAR